LLPVLVLSILTFRLLLNDNDNDNDDDDDDDDENDDNGGAIILEQQPVSSSSLSSCTTIAKSVHENVPSIIADGRRRITNKVSWYARPVTVEISGIIVEVHVVDEVVMIILFC
jgi:hypothetical protein